MAATEESVFIKGEPVTEEGLKVIIGQEMENALGVDGGKLSVQRRDALAQYEGDKYGNEVDGRSQVVDRTIMETVEWVMPAVMRIFAASDKIVQVEPQLPQDEELARQQTEYLNYIFMRDNPGFMLLYTWFKDALLQKLGWIIVYWDTERKTETEKYSGLSQEQYDALKADPDLEEVECTVYPLFGPIQGLVHAEDARKGEQHITPTEPLSPLAPKPLDNLEAGMQSPTVYDCTFRRTYNEGRVRVENVAPEEVLISRRATSDHVPFLCRRRRCTRSELIEMGFDYETVMTLSPFDEQEYNTERIQRFQKNDEWPYRSSRTDPAMVEVWVNQCYLKVDMEGDGIAKLRKVTVGGDKTYVILGNDLIDEVELHSTTPIPMPHTLVGMSLADLVGDLQLIKTTLWRQILDNLYLTNNPRHYVNEDAVSENTYDDLLTSRPGSLVRGHGPQENVVTPLTTPFVAGQSFQMLSYLDEQAEKRSGISKGNQGIAPDDLNKNAAIGSMGVGMLQEAAAQRVELIARIFGHYLVKVFRSIMGNVIRNQQDPRIVKLTGKWTPVNPASWKTQFELTPTVGLGTGNRDKMVGQLSQLLGMQIQGVTLQKGINGPLITGRNIYNTVKQMANAMGFKNGDDFVSDPAQAPPPPPPEPDPMVQASKIKAGADLQKHQITTQLDTQKSAAEMQMRERLGVAELQMKFQIEMAKLGLEGKRLELDWTAMNKDHALKTAEALHSARHDNRQQRHDAVMDVVGAVQDGRQQRHNATMDIADHNLARQTAAASTIPDAGTIPRSPD